MGKHTAFKHQQCNGGKSLTLSVHWGENTICLTGVSLQKCTEDSMCCRRCTAQDTACLWFFIFLEGVIIAIKCYPESPTTIHFLSLTEKKKKKKRTKGFFEILLLICVKVAQISKYVAAKSYWKSWGGVGEGFFFLCMRAKCCCFHTVISN